MKVHKVKTNLAIVMALTSQLVPATAITVLAQNTIESNTTSDVEVTADVSSSWTVMIPKQITLTPESSESGTGVYNGTIPVAVQGDIGVKETIVVDTLDTFNLKDATGASNEESPATVTKNKTEFTFTDLTNNQISNTTHQVSAELHPGEWKGILPFNINLKRTTQAQPETPNPDNPGQEDPNEVSAGLYDANNNLVARWDETNINITKDFNYMYDDYKQDETSLWYALNNDYQNVTKVVLPSNTKRIGSSAFTECNIEEVVLPEGIEVIADKAFILNDSLKTVNLPNTITYLGEYAFYYCESLESITIPTSIDSLGESTFASCTSLKSVTIPSNIKTIGVTAFDGCNTLETVVIEDGVEEIAGTAFASCTSLKSVVIPNSVRIIDSGAFYECESLETVVMSNTVESIGDEAFFNCTNIENIQLPNTLTFVGMNAFSGVQSVCYNGDLDTTDWGANAIHSYEGSTCKFCGTAE